MTHLMNSTTLSYSPPFWWIYVGTYYSNSIGCTYVSHVIEIQEKMGMNEYPGVDIIIIYLPALSYKTFDKYRPHWTSDRKSHVKILTY